ncbi:major capsid hexamer protein [Mycobacterium phage Zenteno07]|nr:major capsid hexamer protein [Mycobacterium phage Zenteno07]
MSLPSARHRRVNILARAVGQFAHQMPEQLPETVEELDALLNAARADINVIAARRAAGETLTGADRDRLKELLGDIDTLTSARAEAATAAAAGEPADDAELDALLAQAQGGGEGGEGQPEGEPEGQPEGEPEGGDEGGEGAPEGQPAGQVQEPVLAGAPSNGQRPVTFAGAGAGGVPPATVSTKSPGWQLHPGAPGFKEGMGKVGFKEISLALESIRPGSRAAIRPNRPNKTMDGQEFARQVVSTLEREVEVVGDSHALVAAITEATKSRNLAEPTFDKRGSLVAAGGWCAPSEQLYDFCDVPDATDLVSLPEITINRGGIRWPREPDLSGIFEDFEWFFTEPELEATDAEGNPTAIKTCVEVPCPEDFDEIRLNAMGWCVEAGILQEQGWPELVEWFMRSLTQEHIRALSRRTILNMVAGSGAPIVIPPTSTLGAAPSVLNSLALMATNIRLKRGLARNATIEGVAPSWFHEVLRADLAMREGGVEVFAVTDAQINSALAARNISLQFVGDWQTRAAGLPGNLATLVWPETVDVLLYPAGTWFRSMSNVIELGVMYPKEQLQVNRFTRMFTEDALAVGKRCGESVVVRIPLNVSGAIGERVAATNVTP